MTETHTNAAPRRRIVLAALGLAVAAIAVGLGLLVLYARGGGPVPSTLAFLRPAAADPLAASGPAEQTLRTLRLAGIDQASVGSDEGTVVVRVQMPATTSAKQVEATWQTALSAGAVAYPRAATIVAQVFSPDGSPLLEVATPAGAVRASAERRGARALRERSRFRYLASAGGSR